MGEKVALRDIYSSLKSKFLSEMGIDDPLIRSILSFRLLIERIGEKKNNNWWDSRVLDSFGRSSMEEIVDKSVLKAQMKLAQKTGRKAEEDIIESTLDGSEEYISLFYLGPYVENKLTSVMDELDVDSDLRIDELENLEIDIGETGWSEDLTDFTAENYEERDTTLLLGQISESELESEERISEILNKLVYCYGESIKSGLKVPCYEVKHE